MKILLTIINAVVVILLITLLVWGKVMNDKYVQLKSNLEDVSSRHAGEAQGLREHLVIQERIIEDLRKDLLNQRKQIEDLSTLLSLEKKERLRLESENRNIRKVVGDQLGGIARNINMWQKDLLSSVVAIEKKGAVSEEKIKGISKKLSDLDIPEINYRLLVMQDSINKMLSTIPSTVNSEEVKSLIKKTRLDYSSDK